MRRMRVERGSLELGVVGALGLFAALLLVPRGAAGPGTIGAGTIGAGTIGGGELDELARELRAERPDARRRAVKKIAALDEREGWELVLAALDDPEPEVADEAQFQLAGLGDERLLHALLDREGLRSRDELRRLRAAEAFGRMRVPIDGEKLLRAVSRADPATSRAVLWSAERLAGRGLLEGRPDRLRRKLESALAHSMPGELAAAGLCALAAFDAEAVRAALADAQDDRRDELRAAAATLAGLLDEGEALAMLRALAADEAQAVRALALEGLAELGTRESLSVLVDRMEREPRARQKWRALELLQELSGMKYRLDPRPWRLWISKLPPDWRPTAAGAAHQLGTGTVALAGLRVLSDRVAILVDFSGSLWYERENGRRKEKVDEKLREALPSLPEGTEFNLVPYTAEPHPWMDRLVEHSPSNVRSALRYFERCDEHGKGNFFDAALWALRDPRVDTILVLTDGVPTGGHRWKLELMMPLLVHETRFRRVAFDSIVVDAPPRVERHWAWLAKATGGKSLAIEL